jgi:hypothetical protein
MQAGTGIAELIALEMSRQVCIFFIGFLFHLQLVHKDLLSNWPNKPMQTESPIEECRKKIWLVDSKV